MGARGPSSFPVSRVRLRQDVGDAPAGSERRVLGYRRLDIELVVVHLDDSGRVLDVPPDDLERILD